MKTISVLLLTVLWLGCGGYGSPGAAPQPGTVPTIIQLVPDSESAGGPAFTLTVHGTGFNTDAVVNWNGSMQATTYVNGSQLTIMVPASAITTAGNVPVTVTNPGHSAGGMYGAGGTAAETSAAMTFTVN